MKQERAIILTAVFQFFSGVCAAFPSLCWSCLKLCNLIHAVVTQVSFGCPGHLVTGSSLFIQRWILIRLYKDISNTKQYSSHWEKNDCTVLSCTQSWYRYNPWNQRDNKGEQEQSCPMSFAAKNILCSPNFHRIQVFSLIRTLQSVTVIALPARYHLPFYFFSRYHFPSFYFLWGCCILWPSYIFW